MKKFLLAINGETYRCGPQGSRDRGSQESYDLQNLASYSHIEFIEQMKKKFQINSDVLLYVYKLNEEWDKNFQKKYEEYLKDSIILSDLLGEGKLHENLLSHIRNKIQFDEYEFILFIRPDLYLKKYFFEIFEITYDKIKFAHINEITDHLGKSWHESLGHPSVNHQIFYVPNPFYKKLFDNCIWNNHNSYYSTINSGLNNKQIGFFLDTYHSSSTSNTWNPIFHQVGREETKFWVDHDFIVDSDTHKPKKVVYDGRYDHLKNNDFNENYK